MRTVLLTHKMNLYPNPVSNTAGYDICLMIGCTPRQYLERFEIKYTYRQDAKKVWKELEGRRIIIIGREVLRYIKLEVDEPILSHMDETGREWRFIPGLSNKDYNEPMIKLSVSLLLRDWYETDM